MRNGKLWAGVSLLVTALVAAGCGPVPTPAKSDKDEKPAAHGHPDEGPHHGSLVEWGDEEYHLEFTADREKGTVTVYVLGGDAKKVVPVKADKLTLSSKDPDFQIELKPAPQEGDPAGQSSRFTGTLPDSTRGRKLSGEISGVADGVPYAGKFKEGHAHKH